MPEKICPLWNTHFPRKVCINGRIYWPWIQVAIYYMLNLMWDYYVTMAGANKGFYMILGDHLWQRGTTYGSHAWFGETIYGSHTWSGGPILGIISGLTGHCWCQYTFHYRFSTLVSHGQTTPFVQGQRYCFQYKCPCTKTAVWPHETISTDRCQQSP